MPPDARPETARPDDPTLTAFVAHCNERIAQTHHALAQVYNGLDFLASREAWHDDDDEQALEALFDAYRASRRAVKAMEEAQVPNIVRRTAA